MDWSIQEIARLSGTTSRTLRHYDEIGLLPPSRVGDNGYRYYDEDSLTPALPRTMVARPARSSCGTRCVPTPN